MIFPNVGYSNLTDLLKIGPNSNKSSSTGGGLLSFITSNNTNNSGNNTNNSESGNDSNQSQWDKLETPGEKWKAGGQIAQSVLNTMGILSGDHDRVIEGRSHAMGSGRQDSSMYIGDEVGY